MKIRSLNNATVLVENTKCYLLIDPWLVGTLYGGAWSPFATLPDLEFLKSVTHVFVSHIHEDHWDRETLDLLNRKVEFYIPDLPINVVLKNRIEELGFTNIKLVKPFEKINLTDMDLTIVPPMNAFGQELGLYHEGYEFDATHIDTSLLVEDKESNTSHLFLCDNTPYDLKVLENIEIKNLNTLWYPFNSYAQDYPVCYNLNEQEKSDIHDAMHEKRKLAVEKCLIALNPEFYFPHSADFVLNGPMSKSFEDYTSLEYMDRKLVAKTYSFPNINSQSEYAYYGDELEFESGKKMKIHRNRFAYDPVSSNPALEEFKSVLQEDESHILQQAFSRMLNRCEKFKIDLSSAKDWLLNIIVENNKYIFSYELKRLKKNNEKCSATKTLSVKLSRKQLAALMSRELHWNNAQIGCHVRFERLPNEYCQQLYKSLNFLHL